MSAVDRPPRPMPWILIGVGTAILLAYGLVPSELCPKCLGFTIAHNERTVRGLPDASGFTPCVRCQGRGLLSASTSGSMESHRDGSSRSGNTPSTPHPACLAASDLQ